MKRMPTIAWEIHYHHAGKWSIDEYGCDSAAASAWFDRLRSEGYRAELVQVTLHREVIDTVNASNTCGFKRRER